MDMSSGNLPLLLPLWRSYPPNNEGERNPHLELMCKCSTQTHLLRMYAYIQPPPEIKFKIFRDSIEFVNTTDPTTAKRRKPRGENSRKKKETAVVSRNQIRVSARLRWFIYFQGEKRWDVIVRPFQRQQQQSFQQI